MKTYDFKATVTFDDEDRIVLKWGAETSPGGLDSVEQGLALGRVAAALKRSLDGQIQHHIQHTSPADLAAFKTAYVEAYGYEVEDAESFQSMTLFEERRPPTP